MLIVKQKNYEKINFITVEMIVLILNSAHLPTKSMRADVTNVQQSVKIRRVEAAIVQDLVHFYLNRDQDIRMF